MGNQKNLIGLENEMSLENVDPLLKIYFVWKCHMTTLQEFQEFLTYSRASQDSEESFTMNINEEFY